MSKNILVTGGCGFIGSEFIKHQLIKTDNRILNIDCLTYAANELNLKGYRQDKNYCFEKVDICDPIDIESIFKRFEPEILINLGIIYASSSFSQRSFRAISHPDSSSIP